VKAGAVRVPLNVRLAADEQARMLAATGVRLLVHDVAQAERAGELASRIDGLRLASLGPAPQVDALDLLAEMGQASDADPRVPASASDPVLVIYTSGTTGTLKAVVHTRRAGRRSPRMSWLTYLGDLARYRATEINLVPTMLGMLVASGAAERADVSHLRTAFYGASLMPRPVLEQALGLWGHRLVQYYGQTEAPLAIAVLDADDHRDPSLLGTCGHPSVDAEVAVTGQDGTPVAAGEVGEVRVRAPFGMAGYHQAPGLTPETITDDGWIRTRDLARTDDRGYLTLVDRSSDMIISGGYNVYPREVEEALLAHPAVTGAAVVGAPDDTWVEAVTAFVTLRPGASISEDELRQAVRSRLAGYKVPKTVQVIDAIPMSPVGKVLRRALRDPLWSESDR
jgi:acyl-CoA synthetase (AMP-forming)/AMP-acid ligase II